MDEKKALQFTREDTTVVKAVAVILMVIHHLFGFSDRIGENISYSPILMFGDTPVIWLLSWFGNVCVYIFAFLGGYGIYISCRGKKDRELARSLGRRIMGLYKQYWTVFLVFIPICILRGVPQIVPDITRLARDFIGMYISYNGEWWFFTPYVMLLFTYPLLRNISDRFRCPFTELLGVVLCKVLYDKVVANLPNNDFVWWKIREWSYLLPAFWLGCIFAKYDFLSWLKNRFSGNALYSLASVIILAICLKMRTDMGSHYDYAMVPLLVICIVVALNHKWGKWIRIGLVYIGNESTFIWLTHSIFCYQLCQRIVYAPKYSILIVIWLLIMCLVTAKLLRLLMKAVGLGWNKIKPLLEIQSLEN